jgi:putative ATP-dependent endonuclease of the OLD family
MRIARLMVERFRGIHTLVWDPAPGLNCIVGPADAGKTTVLAAIELLLAPFNPTLFEFDYWRRRVEDGFRVSAVLADLPQDFLASFRVPPLHGFADGVVLDLPENEAEPVVLAVVRGTAQLEAEHVLVHPSGDETRFGLGLRQRISSTRLSWDRTDIELRLSRGSLLQRHIGGEGLRGALTGVLAEASKNLAFPPDVTARVTALSTLYTQAGLPSTLHLGLQSPRRESLLGLLGLLEGPSLDDAVPVGLAGAGTKRLAAFELAVALGASAQIVLLDEPEVGLEPYRQRHMITRLRGLVGTKSQAFLTTHSPAVLVGLEGDEIARLTPQRCPIRLPKARLDRILAQDPEAMLARVPILCEGQTEAGFLQELLPHVAGMKEPNELDARGVHFVIRNGQPEVLKESEALADAGIRHGLFVDNEATHGGMRAKLARHWAVAVGVWTSVCNIEEAIAKGLPLHNIEPLLELTASLQGPTVVGLRQAVGDKAGSPGRLTFADLAAKVGEISARDALAAAMASGSWFKSTERAAQLGRFLIERGVPPQVQSTLEAFWQSLKPWVMP